MFKISNISKIFESSCLHILIQNIIIFLNLGFFCGSKILINSSQIENIGILCHVYIHLLRLNFGNQKNFKYRNNKRAIVWV